MSYVVVKLGGHALDSLETTSPVLRDLAADIAELKTAGEAVVVVHGGGPQIAQLLSEVGVPSVFHEGLRVTSPETMKYVAMALGEVNVRIVAALQQAGLNAIGLCGTDGNLVRATAMGEPWDRAGMNPQVDASLLDLLCANGFTPVVSPVATDENGELLNCNADTTAGAIAGALGADLLLLSDIDQLRANPDDADSVLESVASSVVRELITSGAARDGMKPKMTAALDALQGGAVKVTLGNGTRPHALRDVRSKSIPTTEVLA